MATQLCLVIAAGWIVWAEANLIPLGVFGTPTVPHSDALGPWLHGAVGYALDDRAIWYLYRPTIGVFFSSILSIHFDTRMIPAVFALASVAFLASLPKRMTTRINWAISLWLLTLAYGYTTYFGSIAPWTLTIDFPAFFFTLAGTLLGIHALERRLPIQLIAAFGLLGLAGALRGPMLAGGLALGGIALLVLWRHPRRFLILCASAIAFVTPFLIDVSLQRAAGVINNGILNLYCFHADPSGAYTIACQDKFQLVRPSNAQVLNGYLAHLLSAQGVGQVWRNLSMIVSYVTSSITFALLPFAALFALAAITTGIAGKTTGGMARRLATASAVLVLLALATRLLAQVSWAAGDNFAIATIFVGTLIVAWWRKSLWISVLLSVFLSGAIFLALLGLRLPRLNETFAFTLHLAVLLALVESVRRPGETKETPPAIGNRYLLGALLALILTLYGGHVIVDPSFKNAYLTTVKGAAAGIKISSDRRLDRSLYYLGVGNFVYARFDAKPIGTPIRYTQLIGADGGPPVFNNESLFRPIVFIP